MHARHFIRQHLSLESVDFQSPVLFKELTAAFDHLRSFKKDQLADHEFVHSITKLVQEHTGLKIAFDIGKYDPCVEIPLINKNNVLVNSFIRNLVDSTDGLKMIDEAGGVCRGTVNIKTGKVSGVFCDVEHTIHLPLTMFTTAQYSSEEIAAVTLHEIGHLMVFYEYMTRTVTTNQALAGVVKALDGTDSYEKRVAILTRAKEVLKLKELDAQALAESKNKKIAETVIITQTVLEAKSELGSNVYDFSSWEYLADQFAARMGAGRYIVTALEKMHRGVLNHISFRSLPAYLAWEAWKIVNLVGSVIIIGQVPQLANLLVYTSILPFLFDAEGDGTYDTPEARFKRVRDQIVANLKDKKLSKDDVLRLTEDLEAIDKVMEGVHDRRQLLGVIWDFLSPASRNHRNQKLLQKELEDLAVNDLFVKAAQLRQLA